MRVHRRDPQLQRHLLRQLEPQLVRGVVHALPWTRERNRHGHVRERELRRQLHGQHAELLREHQHVCELHQ
jgi:hypothetical protein